MRVSSRRAIIGTTLASIACMAALVGCEERAKDGVSGVAGAGASAAASTAESKAAEIVPSLPAEFKELLDQLPGHVTEQQALSGLRSGMLVTTEKQEGCDSTPSKDEDGRFYVLAGMLKPNSDYPVVVVPLANTKAESLTGDMKLVTRESSFVVLNFQCEGWEPGKYRLTVMTGSSPLYEMNIVVAG